MACDPHIGKEIEQSDIAIATAEMLISEQLQTIENLRDEEQPTVVAEGKLRFLKRASLALMVKRKAIFWRCSLAQSLPKEQRQL